MKALGDISQNKHLEWRALASRILVLIFKNKKKIKINCFAYILHIIPLLCILSPIIIDQKAEHTTFVGSGQQALQTYWKFDDQGEVNNN
jgi:hypothetical protein